MLASDIENAPVVYMSPELTDRISAEELGLTDEDKEPEETNA